MRRQQACILNGGVYFYLKVKVDRPRCLLRELDSDFGTVLTPSHKHRPERSFSFLISLMKNVNAHVKNVKDVLLCSNFR